MRLYYNVYACRCRTGSYKHGTSSHGTPPSLLHRDEVIHVPSIYITCTHITIHISAIDIFRSNTRARLCACTFLSMRFGGAIFYVANHAGLSLRSTQTHMTRGFFLHSRMVVFCVFFVLRVCVAFVCACVLLGLVEVVPR